MSAKNYALGLGVVFAGVAGYLVVTKTIKAGGDVKKAAKEILTKDLNPASTENVVYKAASKVADIAAADGQKKPLGVRAWEWMNPEKLAAENALTGAVTPKPTATQLALGYSQGGPSTGVYAMPGGDQSEAESARLRRGEAAITAPKNFKNLIDFYDGSIPDYWKNGETGFTLPL